MKDNHNKHVTWNSRSNSHSPLPDRVPSPPNLSRLVVADTESRCCSRVVKTLSKNKREATEKHHSPKSVSGFEQVVVEEIYHFDLGKADAGVEVEILVASDSSCSSKAQQHVTATVLPNNNKQASEPTEQYYVKAAARVAIQSVVKSMKEHSNNEHVQRYGMGVLYNLACQNDINRKLIYENRGIHVILSGMQQMIMVYNLQQRDQNNNNDAVGLQALELGCLALGALAKNSVENSQRIAELGGIDLMLQVLRSKDAVKQDDDAKFFLQAYAFSALFQLAHSRHENKEMIVQKGGIDIIQSSVMRSSNDYHGERSKVHADYGEALLRCLITDSNDFPMLLLVGAEDEDEDKDMAAHENGRAPAATINEKKGRRNDGTNITDDGISAIVAAMIRPHNARVRQG